MHLAEATCYGMGNTRTTEEDRMLNQAQHVSCPGGHRELLCEDCDARRASRATLAQLDATYAQGRVPQHIAEAYRYLHPIVADRLAPTEQVGTLLPDARRAARKILHFLGLPTLAAVSEV